jgi:hypothetical protein
MSEHMNALLLALEMSYEATWAETDRRGGGERVKNPFTTYKSTLRPHCRDGYELFRGTVAVMPNLSSTRDA